MWQARFQSMVGIGTVGDLGADLSLADRHGHTALHHAVRRGRIPVVTLLIERGAGVDVPSRSGRTPLAYAEEHNSPEVSAVLRSAGADPTWRDRLRQIEAARVRKLEEEAEEKGPLSDSDFPA